MAAPQVRACCGCKFMLIILVIIIIAIVALCAFGSTYLDKTIAELGYGDYQIMNGYTIAELGLADLTIRECFSTIRLLNNPQEEDFITKPYDDSDIEEVAVLFYGSYLSSYSSLATEPAYLTESSISLKDTNLAYILNSVLNDTIDEYAKLNDLDMSILQVSIYKLNGEYIMSVGSSISIPDSNEVLSTIFSSDIYIVSNYVLTADSEGVLQLEASSISVNGLSANTIIDAIFTAFSDEQTEQSSSDEFCNYLGSFISTVVANIGSVAEVTTDENGNITSTTYGTDGISDSKLTLVSHTK